MNQQKDNLRTQIKNLFLTQNPEELKRKSQIITQAILDHPQYQSATTVAIYDPTHDEPDISSIDTGTKRVIIISQSLDALMVTLPSDTFFLIPGRAFTTDGKRLGRGGGWFDRSLSKYPDAYKVGVCFDFQICDRVPQDSWDVRMDEVIFA